MLIYHYLNKKLGHQAGPCKIVRYPEDIDNKIRTPPNYIGGVL